MQPVVRKVDHVMVPVTEPGPMFDLFTESLGLPAAWPIHDYGTFRSGGVCLGNVNVEIVTGDSSSFEYFEPWLPATARGIAFEPAASLHEVLNGLDERALFHTKAVEHEDMWTNVYLGGMIGRGAIAFFCEFRNLDVPRGEAATSLLQNAGGGVLGVTGVDEIFISVAEYEKAEARWRALLDPVPPKRPGRWVMPEGPSIRLTEGTRDAVYGIAIRVRSLKDARDALMERGLLGNLKKTSVGLHYPATYGLDVWFVE